MSESESESEKLAERLYNDYVYSRGASAIRWAELSTGERHRLTACLKPTVEPLQRTARLLAELEHSQFGEQLLAGFRPATPVDLIENLGGYFGNASSIIADLRERREGAWKAAQQWRTRLRDKLAIAAMPGAMRAAGVEVGRIDGDDVAKRIDRCARFAYAIADAMLEARKLDPGKGEPKEPELVRLRRSRDDE